MAWADETLATYADVREEYPAAGDLCESEVTETQNTEITAYLAKAKDYIGRKLDVDLSVRYSHKTFTATDLKDLILNPEVFEQAAVSYALFLMFQNAVIGEGDYNHLKQRDYEKKYKEEYGMSAVLMQFDEDESGAASVEEKSAPTGRCRMWRV